MAFIYSLKFRNSVLKAALFATGLSGIVAEYVLSTLATYFLGNSVLQWTLILSFMLFSMGLGSRITKYIEHNLINWFIGIELVLSILVGYCAILTYFASAYASFSYDPLLYILRYDGVTIYMLSILVGLLIGMEIPLVTRLNEKFESLQVNISSVMENDYYGSLAGGLFFAFVGLPILGLTYTPLLLGSINFLVALGLFIVLLPTGAIAHKIFHYLFGGVAIALFAGFFIAQPIIEFGEQKRYKDQVIYQEQSKFQKIVITKWKNHHWLYLNGHQQLSTYDEHLYHEPLVHPAMMLHPSPKNALILGGGDGCAARELLKYPSIENITLVDIDPAITKLGASHPILLNLNDSALLHPKVKMLNQDALIYMGITEELFDIIIVDFPDPQNIDISRLYSTELFSLLFKQLSADGAVCIQSGSPYFAPKAFYCIGKTLRATGFQTLPIHNQVMTMGEWGWHLAHKRLSAATMREILTSPTASLPKTRWLNKDALQLITAFGKPMIDFDSSKVEINAVHNPVLQDYYHKGNWGMY